MPAHLTLLGGFTLTVDGHHVNLCSSAQRLLAHLSVHSRHRPVRRSVLAETLWCDTEPTKAAASLRSVLWRLPKLAAEPLLSCTPATVQLHEGVRVDLWEAEDLADGLAHGTLAPDHHAIRSLRLLGHDLLPGWEEDWLLVEQESHRQTRLHALEEFSARLRGRGEFAGALQAGLAAVRCEPLRESAHRRVIQIHLSEGNQAEALRHYQSFRRLLADELGLPPSPTIRALVAPLLGRPVDRTVTSR